MNDQRQGAHGSTTEQQTLTTRSDANNDGASANAHMAIGEVLALLQEEFPDVTISKIRFLESQGLIAPERTASGYRKFYEADIDRLRWILLQQRDNFLPLKVIKNMLDSGVSTDMGAEEPTLFSEPQGVDGTTEPASSATAAEAGGRNPEHARTHPAVRSFGERSEKMMSPSDASTATQRKATNGAQHNAASHDVQTQPGHEVSPAKATSSSSSDVSPNDPSGMTTATPPRPHTTPADVVAALQELPGATRRTRSVQRAEPLSIPSRSQEPHQELTLDELMESTGVDEELIEALVGFGLISDRNLAGTQVFDPPAEEICRLAVRYRELGVEPRHLRMYKVAAEREAGFIEQSAIPLLKKRNPSARIAAKQRAEELMSLGNELEKLLLIDRLQIVLES